MEAVREAYSTADALREHLRSSAAFAAQLQGSFTAVQAVQQYLNSSAVHAVQEYLDSSVFQAIRAQESLASFNAQVARAMDPLPDIERFAASLTRIEVANFEALNRAIEDSTFLWAADLPARAVDGEPLDGESASEESVEGVPSEMLIELVPAEALERLEAVDLLPLRILDRISKHPTEMHQLTPRQFEELIAEILDGLSFRDILLTPPTRDKGRDIVAVKRVDGIPVLFAFECKRYSPKRRVGVATCRALLGTISQAATKANIGVLVTTSTFTKGASEFFLTETSVKGRDFDGVVEWLEGAKDGRHDA